MKKSFQMLAIAALIVGVVGCSKEEKKVEAPISPAAVQNIEPPAPVTPAPAPTVVEEVKKDAENAVNATTQAVGEAANEVKVEGEKAAEAVKAEGEVVKDKAAEVLGDVKAEGQKAVEAVKESVESKPAK